jgi:hypothetical protein
MKLYLNCLIGFACIALSASVNAQAFANKSLSNLTTTSLNVSLIPNAPNTLSIGSPKLRWKIYANSLTFADGSTQLKAFTPYVAGSGISIRGNVISSLGGTSQWTTNGGTTFCNIGNIGIGVSEATARLEVAGGDAKINGITVGLGSGAVTSNTVVGQQALYNNVSGFSNTVYGNNALYSNNSGYDNAAIGENALYSNVDGLENTAVGNGTLYYNVSGYGNTATGNGALLNNGAVPNPLAAPEGSYNNAYGFFSLFSNSTGSYNAAFGNSSLSTNTTGGYNTGVGAYSDVATEDLSNATAIGANTLVNSSNKIRLGDVNVTVVESAAGSWTTSDGRFKTNIKENVIGLPFIKLLRPVVYNFDAEKFDAFLSKSLPDSIKARRQSAMKKLNAKSNTGNVIQTGFIAQEVADAAKTAGYNYNGVHVPESAADNYSLSYEKLVVPLVKSVQELSAQNEEMKKEIELLKAAINLLQAKNGTASNNFPSVTLQQNSPNPAAATTTISYVLPFDNAKEANIVITDKQGVVVKRIAATQKQGTLTIDTSALVNGTYQYTLYINGAAADTKQMIVAR